MVRDPALREAVVRAVKEAGMPQTVRQIAQRSNRAVARVREVIGELTELGVFYACGTRFWDRDEARLLEAHARRAMAHQPHSKTELVEVLGKAGTGASVRLREDVFLRLKAADGVFVWPPMGRYRSERIALVPADPAHYLGLLKRDFDKVAASLEAVGVPTTDVLAVLGRSETPDLPVPVDDADRDFQAEMAQELVFAWQDADAEARVALARVMTNLGLTRLGEVGEHVAFDGRRYTTQGEPLFPGDLAVIEEPGWQLERGGHARTLVRAAVRGVEPPA